MEKDYKYKAFISYRHCSPDEEVAKRLISLIENYNIPAKIIEKHHTQKKVGRLFRDEDELKANSDLSKTITDALDSSEYLIAICSKEYVMSQWCMLEANYWMEHRDKDKLILVLVEGRSSEAIPQIFCENGRRPFAIDIRGDSVRGIVKNADNQKLRIVSALIAGCDYEDLKLRNKEHLRRQRAKAFVSILAVVMISVTGVFFYLKELRIQQNLKGNANVYGYSYSIKGTEKSTNTGLVQIDDRYSATAVSCIRTAYDYFRTLSVDERMEYLGISPAVQEYYELNDTGLYGYGYYILVGTLSEKKFYNPSSFDVFISEHYKNYTDNDSLYYYASIKDGKIAYFMVGDDEQILKMTIMDEYVHGKIGVAITTEITETELGASEMFFPGEMSLDRGYDNSILFDAEDLSGYMPISNPESLTLENSHGIDIRQLNSYVRTLKKLDLHGSDLSSFEGAAVFEQVTELDISSTKLTDISGISEAFPNLEILNCANIKAENLSELEKLPLRELNISSYVKQLRRIDFSRLKKLEVLDVSNCVFESEDDIKYIAGLTNLKSLNIDGIRWDDGGYNGCAFTDLSVISNLNKLKELNISNWVAADWEKNNIVQSNDLSFLAKFKKLESLIYEDMNLENLNMDFVRNLKNLKEIEIKVGHTDISPLGDLNSLEKILIKTDDAEIISLHPLKNNKQLKDLSLPSNDISDLDALANFTQLEELNIPMHGLTAEEVDILCSIETLKTVRVQRISAKDAKRLKATTGCFIYIQD